MLDENAVAMLRREFPYLSQCTYLDTGATGLAAPGTGKAAAAFFDTMQSRGFDGRSAWMEMRSRVEGKLASLLSVTPDQLDFAASSTDALTRAVQALPVAPGDTVVLAADEFPSVRAAMHDMAARGAMIQCVEIPDEASRTERLASAARGAQHLAVSHVHWETGTRADLAALSRICRAEGVTLIVDGVHAVGSVPVDASLADIYVTSFFKWTLAGFGLGLCITSPDQRARMIPRQRGYANPAPSRSLQHSHTNYPGIAALEAALDYIAGLGWSDVFTRVAMLQADLADRLRMSGFTVVTPPGQAAGLVAVAVNAPEVWSRQLAERGVRVSARGKVLRMASHFYNNKADIDACCAAMIDIAGLTDR